MITFACNTFRIHACEIKICDINRKEMERKDSVFRGLINNNLREEKKIKGKRGKEKAEKR